MVILTLMAVGGGDCSRAGRGLRAEVDPAGTAEIYTLDVGRWEVD